MKKAEMIKRIEEIFDEKNVDNFLVLEVHNVVLSRYDNKMYVRYGEARFLLKKLRSWELASILFEVGNADDRKNVKQDVLLTDYAIISNRLGLFNHKF